MANPTQITSLKIPTVTLTAARTLTDADSGITFVIGAAATAAITLPKPKNGLKFRFVTGFAITGNWTVGTNAAATIIQGPLTIAGLIVAGSNEKTVTFVNTADSLGDWVNLESDGTYWYVSGVGEKSGSITLT